MAMIICRECGADISDQAATCPYCGAPLPKKPKDNTPIIICRPHWLTCVSPCIIGAIFFVIGILLARFLPEIFYLGIWVCVIATAAAVWACIVRKHAKIWISERMLVGRVGIIRTKNLSAPLDKIQDISIENGLWGKIFHYHTIKIATAGTAGDEYVFTFMTHANELRTTFLSLV